MIVVICLIGEYGVHEENEHGMKEDIDGIVVCHNNISRSGSRKRVQVFLETKIVSRTEEHNGIGRY
jgi:hypothetical protein